MKQELTRLLLVEDNLGDKVLIEDYLNDYTPGTEVMWAQSYQEALKHLVQEPEVILLDLTLPDHQGEGLIVDMVKAAGLIPVIILTGHAKLDFSIHSIALGAADYLIKDG